jgi:toxin-antitoxin system PIN domain toxin
MTLSKSCLLDVNALIALADAEHVHYQSVMDWFDRDGHRSWGICPLTEAGFVRVTINPVMKARARTLAQAVSILQLLKGHPGCRSWNIDGSWVDLTAPFATRIVGHHQVMDALLLGLAVREGGVLVTFDRGLKYVAGDKFSQNLLVLEQG